MQRWVKLADIEDGNRPGITQADAVYCGKRHSFLGLTERRWVRRKSRIPPSLTAALPSVDAKRRSRARTPRMPVHGIPLVRRGVNASDREPIGTIPQCWIKCPSLGPSRRFGSPAWVHEKASANNQHLAVRDYMGKHQRRNHHDQTTSSKGRRPRGGFHPLRPNRQSRYSTCVTFSFAW